MEEDFLEIGFADPALFEEFPDSKQESSDPDPDQNNPDPDKEPDKDPDKQEDKAEERNKENKESKENSNENQGSPNISSSIALALMEDGVLQTLDKERVEKIQTAEDLIEAFREDQRNQLDERQKRIDEALNYRVEPSLIQQYENIINSLDQITDEFITGEGDENEKYRKGIIYQNYLNKGFSEDDAKEMVERSVESGNDIKDAQKALESCKTFYNKEYTAAIDKAKADFEKQQAAYKKQASDIKDAIMKDDEFFNKFEISKAVRQKIYDTVAKPVHDNGNDTKITTLQKYLKENPIDAYKKIGTLYVITEGFTKFENIFQGSVKKEVRKSVENLERALKQTSTSDGSLNLRSGIGEDSPKMQFLDFDI